MSKLRVVVTIAESVGLLKPCKFEICDELIWDDSDEHLESAYRYAAHLFKNNAPLTRDFKSQKELTDRIKSLEDDFGTECVCERQIAED